MTTEPGTKEAAPTVLEGDTPPLDGGEPVEDTAREVTEYYEAGQIKEVSHFRGEQIHGQVTLYREDGSLESRSHFADGALHGLAEIFDETGSPAQQANYINGAVVGEVKIFDAEGEMVETVSQYIE